MKLNDHLPSPYLLLIMTFYPVGPLEFQAVTIEGLVLDGLESFGGVSSAIELNEAIPHGQGGTDGLGVLLCGHSSGVNATDGLKVCSKLRVDCLKTQILHKQGRFSLRVVVVYAFSFRHNFVVI